MRSYIVKASDKNRFEDMLNRLCRPVRWFLGGMGKHNRNKECQLGALRHIFQKNSPTLGVELKDGSMCYIVSKEMIENALDLTEEEFWARYECDKIAVEDIMEVGVKKKDMAGLPKEEKVGAEALMAMIANSVAALLNEDDGEDEDDDAEADDE